MTDDPRGKGTLDVSMQEYVDALVEPVSQRMRAGDVTLREHLERILREHSAQVDRALAQADALERERIATLHALLDERWARLEEQIASVAAAATEAIEQLRRERELVTAAQTEAIRKAETSTTVALDKAELANDKRFSSVNEFREQLRDMMGRFALREVVDAQLADVRRAVADLAEKISKLA